MYFDAHCIECLVKRQTAFALGLGTEAEARDYMKDVLRVILEASDDTTAPELSARFFRRYKQLTGIGDAYADVKRKSNEYMLEKLPAMRAAVSAAPDPILAALRYAAVGNYIDFGSLAGRVSMAELDGLLGSAQQTQIDPAEYGRFVSDVSAAKKVLYIADNAGEIVADLVLAEELKRAFPALDLCFGVRGAPAQNDALREDAEAVGITRIARVVGSGCDIVGTPIGALGDEMRRELFSADAVLAKGQGNFETLGGCGLNVYYIFMCKCVRFTDLFHVPPLTGLFVNERRIGERTAG